MDEKHSTTRRGFHEGAACAVDRSCCGGASEANLVDAGCTLNPSEMPERVARWRALFGDMLGYDRRSDHVVFRFSSSADVDATLLELVKLEQVCCRHVSWGLEREGKETLLTLRAEPAALGALVAGFTGGFGGGA